MTPLFAALRPLAPLFAVGLLLTGKQLYALALQRIVMKASIAPASLAMALLLLVPLLALVPQRAQRFTLIAADALYSFVAWSDAVHHRIFGEVASLAMLGHAGQLGDVWSSVQPHLRAADLLFFAELPALPFLLPRLSEAPAPRLRLLAVAALAIATMASVIHVDPTRYKQHRGSSRIASRWGLFGWHAHDGLDWLASLLAPRGAPPGVLDGIAASIRARRAPAGPLFGVAAGRDAIVVQVESWMDFTVGLTVGGREVTPHLNRLAQESLRFTELYEHNGSGLTADADFATNCSLYPQPRGAVYVDHARLSFRCLPGLLAADGRQTVAMQAIRPDFWNLSTVYPRVGFQRYFAKPDFAAPHGQVGLGLGDEDFLAGAAEKLDDVASPRHAFLVTLTSHHPYDWKAMPRLLPLPPELQGTVVGNYLVSLHYTDRALGAFVDALRASGALDRAVLVLYGDHRGLGVERSDDVAKLAGVPLERRAERLLLDRNVPLFIRLPQGAHAGTIDALGGQVDTAPTLLGLLGLGPGEAPMLGRDLLSAPAPERVVPIFDGSAISRTRVWRPAADERCWDRVNAAKLPDAGCEREQRVADEELSLAQRIIERDLPALLATRLRPTAP